MLISIGYGNNNVQYHVPPPLIQTVADDVMASSRESSMAVQDTSVLFDVSTSGVDP